MPKIDSLRHSDLYSKEIFAYVYARSGRKGEAVRFLESNLKNLETDCPFPTAVAILYSALGDKDNAFVWLQRGYESRDHQLLFIKDFRALAPLRSEPRFIELLKKIGLRK